MTQPDRCGPHGPRRRNDSTRPPATRRGGDRRPYPTASTTTRVSISKPGSVGATVRSGGAKSTPIPATVWPAGPVAIDLDAVWPTAILTTIVTSFSVPGGRVVLLPWPSPHLRARLASVGADGVIDHAPGTELDGGPDAELADALDTITGLDRAGRVVRVAVDPSAAGPASRPFWADLVGGPDRVPTALSELAPCGGDASVLDAAPTGARQVDLIITSLRPEHSGDRAGDLVALLAARLLRVGGVLAVLTHGDWTRGELVDPSGPVVASAQNADLLYLQHVVALHAPVRDGEFATDSDGPTAEESARARHRAQVRGLPAPHQRIHSDVLVFAQPHDHESPAPAAADAAFETGVIR